MGKNKTRQSKRLPTHVVSLYNYVPGETEVADIGDTWSVAPHVAMHLSFLKGDTFILIGDLDWWLYVTSSSGKTGYIPSVFMAPLKNDSLNSEYHKILQHHGDVPCCAVDMDVDLFYFPNSPLDRSIELSQRKSCPGENANIFSTLTFWWMTRLVWLGYRQPLTSEDLWSLRRSIKSKTVVTKFETVWKSEKEKTARKLDKRPLQKTASMSNGKTPDELQSLHDTDVKFSSDEKRAGQPSLLKILSKVFIPYLLPGTLLKLVHDSLLFVQPILLGMIIEFVENKDDRPFWHGFGYATAMFVVGTIKTLILHQYFTIIMETGLRVRSAVLGAVYRKALVLSTVSRNQSTVGEMVNLMSVDAQRLMDILTYLNMLWSAPFQITLATVFLYRTMGIPVLAGVGVMLVLFPINLVTGRWLRSLQVKQMNIKDSRIKLMNEILSGIKVLKLFAWETSFMAKILGVRKQELRHLRVYAHLQAAYTFLWNSAPFIVSLATFGVYVLLGNNLTASKAFVALALFNILRFPLSMLPNLLSSLIQALVSAKRLQKFLNMEELDPNHVQRTTEKENTAAIRILDGTFTWEFDDKPTLQHINLHVDSGLLIAVVGQLGSGKSSLLSAMLGEIRKLQGEVYLKGSVAYVPQQAWIQNTTMRGNILFGKPFDPKQYHKVIGKCSLVPDIEILPGGDMTEIGEKGINLSGGQKQRVSLARAVYTDADVYLLDDPLSAVDSHVGKHIFDHIIGPKGMLKKKMARGVLSISDSSNKFVNSSTRVLVTHQVRFLSQVDQIIVLRNGAISEVGSYSELLENGGDFAEFLRTFAKEHENVSVEVEQHVRAVSQLSIHSCNSPMSDRTVSRSSLISNESQRDVLLTELEKKAREENKMIPQEKAETGRVKVSVFLYYFSSCGAIMSFVMLLCFVAAESSITGSRVWLAFWSSANITTNSEQNKYVGIYGGLGTGQAFFIFVGATALAFLSVKGSTVLHENLLDNILRLPMSFFETTPLGRIVNRFSKDIDVIDTLIPQTVSWFVRTVVTIIGTLFLICFSTPFFLIVMLPLFLLYVFIQRLYVPISRQLQRLESVGRSPIYSHFFETINGVSTIRAFNAQGRFISLNDNNVDENQMAAYPSIMCNRWLAVRLEFIGNCIVFFAALFGVVARNNIESGLVGLSITVSLRITQTLNWMVRQTSDMETRIVSVERIKEYTQIKQEASWIIPSKRAPDNWPQNGEIEITNLGVRYREGLNLALQGLTCHIYSNEKIGIVGRTGSGKSTFAMALFRVIEVATGTIVIDGIDIANIGLHDLRSKLTIIPQDPILFSASLRFNLDPFDKHTDKEIWTVLEVTHLKSFVASLDNTLDYAIAEGGENLSVGQRQLVCLARALLRRSKILVLDEATAAVDLETDELIQQTIRKEFADCTVLTIAHRLNTIMDYTRIIVLSEGKVIEFDKPNKLLELKGVFYEMAKDSKLVS